MFAFFYELVALSITLKYKVPLKHFFLLRCFREDKMLPKVLPLKASVSLNLVEYFKGCNIVIRLGFAAFTWSKSSGLYSVFLLPGTSLGGFTDLISCNELDGRLWNYLN